MQTIVAQFAYDLSEYAALLGEVKHELIEAAEAYKRMNREAIHARAAAQAVLAGRVRAFRAQLRDSAAKLPPLVFWPNRIVNLRHYIARVEAEIRSLNAANAVLVKGAARTLRILSNALVAFSPTYANPVRPDRRRLEFAP